MNGERAGARSESDAVSWERAARLERAPGPAGPNDTHSVVSGPAYGSAFAFAGCLPFRFATAQ